MPSTLTTNWDTYATLAIASRAKATTKTDEAPSEAEIAALADCAHALRERGYDFLTFAIQAARSPNNAQSFWAQSVCSAGALT